MTGQEKRAMFAFGAFGGILPTLASLASTYVAQPHTPLPALGLYFGLIMWALVGAGVALTNSSPETRQAIFAGIAAPAILMNIASGATEAKMQKKLAGFLPRIAMFITAATTIPPAFAQNGEIGGTTTTGAGFSATTVLISPQVTGGLPTDVAISVTAEVRHDGKTEIIPIGKIKDLSDNSRFITPGGTSAILVSGQSIPIAQSGETQINLAVKTKPSFAGDFLWSIGVPRQYKIDGIDVSVGTPQPKLKKKS